MYNLTIDIPIIYKNDGILNNNINGHMAKGETLTVQLFLKIFSTAQISQRIFPLHPIDLLFPYLDDQFYWLTEGYFPPGTSPNLLLTLILIVIFQLLGLNFGFPFWN